MNIKKIYIIFILLNIKIISASGEETEENFFDNFSIRGYLKEMPILSLDKDFSAPEFTNIFHNRLNFRFDATDNIQLRLEGRNRVIYNEMFEEAPMLTDIFDQDDGLIDMSWAWLSDGPWLGHSEIDRLYMNWSAEGWRVRVGRQRINWGINLVSNPNDLFNTYSFFDFDYPERPGADAIRIQHYLDHASQIQLAVSPAEDSKEMVAAAMVNFQRWNYDIQTLAGYYKDRSAIGLGWAGNIGGAGFKGEATWFYDLEETPGIDRGNIVAAAGMDYMFSTGTFGVVEFLYNGGYQRDPEQVFLITEPLQPDNIMFSEYAVTLSADHMFSPILNGGMAIMAMPDIEALFVSPNINYSIITDLDLEILAQIFIGGEKGTVLHEYAGSSWIASLKYSF